MLAPPPRPATGPLPPIADSVDDLLDPQLAAALESLDVQTRKRFAGRLMGERRGKQRGRSVEFEDYRPYVPGDDLRHIDWNVFARLDRFFIKIFEEEQDLAVHLVLDASASMDAGRPSKLLAAARIAMGLGYLSLVSNNRVAAWVFTTGSGGSLRAMPAARGREGVRRLGNFLLQRGDSDQSSPAGIPTPDFAAAMRAIANARSGAGGKGVLILLSDFLFPDPPARNNPDRSASQAGPIEAGLNFLVSAGPNAWDATAIQVLSPGEIDPARETDAGGRRTVIGDLRLTDCETGRSAEVTVTDALLARYRQRLAAHQDRLARACAARSIGLTTVPSDTDVARLLLDDLRKRGVVG